MSNKKKFLKLLLLVLFFLILAEIILRIFFPVMDYDSLYCFNETTGINFCNNTIGQVGGYTSEFSHQININSKGWRDFELNDSKTKKIIVLGDSFVANIAIADNKDVFTEVLEASLNGTEVINLGVDGYGITRYYLKLKSEGMNLKPSTVLIMIYIENDFTTDFSFNNEFAPYYFTYENDSLILNSHKVNIDKYDFIPRKGPFNLRVFNVFSKINEIIFKTKEKEKIKYLKILTKLLVPNNRDYDNNFLLSCKIMEQINKELKTKDINFYLVLAPPLQIVRDDEFYKLENASSLDRFLPNKRIMECVNANNISVIDLTSGLIAIENQHESPYLYFNRDSHWTKEGNLIVADIIYKRLFSDGII